MRFGEKLRVLRKEKGLTQAELAETGRSRTQTITNYEKGSTCSPRDRGCMAFLPDSRLRADYLLTRATISSQWRGSNMTIGARRAERL